MTTETVLARTYIAANPQQSFLDSFILNHVRADVTGIFDELLETYDYDGELWDAILRAQLGAAGPAWAEVAEHDEIQGRDLAEIAIRHKDRKLYDFARKAGPDAWHEFSEFVDEVSGFATPGNAYIVSDQLAAALRKAKQIVVDTHGVAVWFTDIEARDSDLIAGFATEAKVEFAPSSQASRRDLTEAQDITAYEEDVPLVSFKSPRSTTPVEAPPVETGPFLSFRAPTRI